MSKHVESCLREIEPARAGQVLWKLRNSCKCIMLWQVHHAAFTSAFSNFCAQRWELEHARTHVQETCDVSSFTYGNDDPDYRTIVLQKLHLPRILLRPWTLTSSLLLWIKTSMENKKHCRVCHSNDDFWVGHLGVEVDGGLLTRYGIWTRCPCNTQHAPALTQWNSAWKSYEMLRDNLWQADLVDLAVAIVSDTENWVWMWLVDIVCGCLNELMWIKSMLAPNPNLVRQPVERCVPGSIAALKVSEHPQILTSSECTYNWATNRLIYMQYIFWFIWIHLNTISNSIFIPSIFFPNNHSIVFATLPHLTKTLLNWPLQQRAQELAIQNIYTPRVEGSIVAILSNAQTQIFSQHSSSQ